MVRTCWVLFINFTGDVGDGTEWTLSRFADNIKLGREAYASESQASIQRDLSKQEKCADGKLMQLKRESANSLVPKKSNSVPSCIGPGVARSSREVAAVLYAALGGTQLQWPLLLPFLCDHIGEKRDQ